MNRSRANGEGSIFPYRNGYAAYVWVTTPTGRRTRKWVYGKTREEATARVQALALRVLADRLEHGEATTDLLSISFQAA